MSERVSCTIADGVADVRLNRPDKLNALDGLMFDALISTAERLGEDGSVRAVVVSGQGRSFCAGLDLAIFAAGGAGSVASLTQRDPNGRVTTPVQRAVSVWSELAVPVIAAIHGHALGGGLQLALGADIRIVAPDAELSVLEIQWGIIPDMTGTLVLPRLVGLDVAKELTFTGRRISGVEAGRLGLATEVSDTPREDALALGRDIAGRNPVAIRAAKSLLDGSGRRSWSEAVRAEQSVQAELLGSPNQLEAMAAYFERRSPHFED